MRLQGAGRGRLEDKSGTVRFNLMMRCGFAEVRHDQVAGQGMGLGAGFEALNGGDQPAARA